ncbi:MAG TPA: methanogenesis marker 12 protein, partial [Methanoregulaceae archaeon]|nr:methanogenesis marker 12 protein [Methanoregulaceae archaeon]
MFVGIDHGTTSMRFSGDGIHWKISREDARGFSFRDLDPIFSRDRIDGIGITYSMGDNFSAITPIHKLQNRGLVSRSGAGKHI